MGNSRARAVYEANLPDSFRRPQTDCSLESFIRAKYEHKKYIAREWVPPPLPTVNWDKELDEEAEKQRRRKKESQKSVTSALPPVKKPEVVPQIPKPRSSVSPKPNRPNNSATLDLLGLDAPESQTSTNGSTSGDDIFTSFLSAPPASGATVANGTSVESNSTNNLASKSEEESFFNQPAPAPQEKNKMTKDSILALYGTQPSQPFGGGMFNQQIPAQQFQQPMSNVGPFNQPLNHSLQSQMGIPGINQMNVAPNQMCINPNQLGVVSGNPMANNAAMSMQTQMQQSVTNSSPQMVLGSNNGWSSMMSTQNLQPAPGSNPFLNLSVQQQSVPAFNHLPQQMSQMSLGGVNFSTPSGKPASASLSGQTLSTNLWQ